MRDSLHLPYQTKCPSCGKMVYPVINIKDDELYNDHAWAECPECHFCTGDRENEIDAFRFFESPGRPQPWSIGNPTIDYEKVFEDFWKGIVLAEDGSPKIDQIKRELYDAHTFMDGAAIVYCHITGDLISKVTTKPEVVIQIADEHYEELYKDIAKEDREQILDHCADWLWSKLMDWCKKHGDAPAKHNDLFALVEELRNKKNEDPE